MSPKPSSRSFVARAIMSSSAPLSDRCRAASALRRVESDSMGNLSYPAIESAFREISACAPTQRQAHALLQIFHRIHVTTNADRPRRHRLDAALPRARAVPGEATGPEGRTDAV